MGAFLSRFVLVPVLKGILRIYDIVPFSNYWTFTNMLTGLIKLVVHRAVLSRENLYKGVSIYINTFLYAYEYANDIVCVLYLSAPFKDDERLKDYDGKPLKTRPADGFGTDVNNATTANHLGPIGRNMPAIPKHLRVPMALQMCKW